MSVDLEDKPGEVYDDNQPAWKTNLHDDDLEKSFDAPAATDKDLPKNHPSRQNKENSSSELRKKEEAAGKSNKNAPANLEGAVGIGYKEDDTKLANLIAKLSGKRKQIAIGGGIAAIFGIAGFSLFMLILPLKILHVVNNMQDKYFGSSETAVEGRVEYYFNRYITDHVLKSLNGEGVCKSTRTIDRSCISPVTGSGPVSTLFRGWQEGRLETKLAERYGLEIERKPNTAEYTLKVNGKVSDIDVEGFRKDPASGLFKATGGRNDIRRSVKEALAGETRWKKVMYRYKVGRLLERKYGIRRCVFACKTADNFADWKDNKKGAFKAMLARRVLEPRSETLGLAMGCIFSTDCDSNSSTDGNDENDLEKKDKLQRNIDKYLAERGAQYSADTVESVSKLVSDITESGGLGKYVITTILEKVFGPLVAKVAEKAIPIVGWIDLVAQFTGKIKSAGPKFKKWAFAVNSAGMVAQYALYRSHADEIKGGKTDIALMGSVVDSLNGMEQSPLYTDVMGNGTGTVKNAFMPSAYAESASSSPKYTCNDGKPVPEGKKICKEESLQFDNLLTDASDLFRKPPLEQLGIIADGWNGSVGKVLAFAGAKIGELVQYFPGMQQLNDLIAQGVQPLIDEASKIIPNPFSDNQSGGRSFNLAAGGADVAGNHNAEFGLGGKRLSNQEVADIRTYRKSEEYLKFKEKPLYARLFDREDSHSLISQVALNTPSTTISYSQVGMASLISNPFSKIISNFGSFFSSKLVLAASAEEDPFGVPQYGYPLKDPAITAETPTDCKAYNKAWAEDTTVDPVSGQDIHNRVNLCLLDQAAIGSAGGYFTADVLTPNDLGVASTPSADSSVTDQSTTATPTGNGKWSLAASANKPGHDLTPLFKSFLDVLSKYTSFEPIVSTGTNHSQYTTSGNVSDHYSGNAADFGSVVNNFGTSNAQSGQIVPRGDEIAAAGMVACGVDPATAKTQAIKGGVYNMNCSLNGQPIRVQVLWKTDTGGNHHNHVHVGIKAL